MSTAEPFVLELLDLHWLDEDDPTRDLCAHGHVRIVIGDEVVCTKESGAWTLSAGALYLMRTIESDYMPGQFGGQLLPCCGFSLLASDDKTHVIAFGCALGIDWHVQHGAGNNIVALTTESGRVHAVDMVIYKREVMALVGAVETFFQSSAPKTLPDDPIDREGYLLFWQEWQRLRANHS